MVSLETTKKGGSMGEVFGNHGFYELGPEYKGKQGPKDSRKEKEIRESRISDWEVLTRALIAKGLWIHQTIPPKLTKWAHQLIDVCRHFTKSVRRLVKGWLAIRQKNTVVWGDFSYGY